MSVWDDIESGLSDVGSWIEAHGETIAEDVLTSVKNYFGGASQSASEYTSSLLQGTEDMFAGGFGGFLTDVGKITGDINDEISGFSKAFSNVVSPLATLVNEVSSVAQNFNDKLFKPVASLIEGSISAEQAVTKGINADLSQGLTGLVKIPSTIANALTSVNAAYQTATQELGNTVSTSIAKTLVPGLENSSSKPLGALGELLTSSLPDDSVNALLNSKIDLTEPDLVLQAQNIFNDWKQSLADSKSSYAPLLKFILSIWRQGWVLVSLAETEIKLASQAANSSNPVDTVDPGDMVEAAYRGLVDSGAFEEELARQGYDATRAQLLMDVAAYLFRPEQNAEMYYRGLIDSSAYEALQLQNKLTEPQAATYLDLTAFKFAQADLITALARGYINENDYQTLSQANHLSEDQATTANALGTAIPSGPEAIAIYHRQLALSQALLVKTLSSGIPSDVLAQYKANRQDQDKAEQDWGLHWNVPPPAWWVQAYFRGIRTKTEVNAAFDYWAVPEELRDDMITVEGDLISSFILVDIFKTGIIDEPTIRSLLALRGLLEPEVELLLKYSAAAGKSSKLSTAGDLQKLSLANAATLYDDGTINSDTYLEVLQQHGYSSEAASLTVQLTDIKNATAQRKAYVTQLVDEVKVGTLTRDSATSSLYNAGFTEAEVAAAVEKIDAAKRLNVKVPTEAQWNKMLKNGVIDAATWTSAMENLGFDSTVIPLLQQII